MINIYVCGGLGKFIKLQLYELSKAIVSSSMQFNRRFLFSLWCVLILITKQKNKL